FDFSYSEIHAEEENNLDLELNRIYKNLESEANEEIKSDEELKEKNVHFERVCELRYKGQAYQVNVVVPNRVIDREILDDLIKRFHQEHHRANGFSNYNEPCEFVTFRVAARVELKQPSVQARTVHAQADTVN